MSIKNYICLLTARAIATFNFNCSKLFGFFLPGTGFALRQISESFKINWNSYELEFDSSMASVYGYLIVGKSNEPETLDYLNYLSNKISDYTFINIGSCIGEFIFTDIGIKSNLVIAVDANINAINTLKYNCSKNNFTHINIYNNIVSDTSNEMLEYYLDVKNPNESSIINNGSTDLSCIKINSITIDSISSCIIGSNLVLLIDVEGAELKVIKGAKNTIEKYNPIIIFEYNYVSTKIFSLTELLDVLPNNYSLYKIPTDEKLTSFDGVYWNLIARPDKY